MPPTFVDADELRRMFNVGRYYERVLAGEFQATVVRQNRPRRENRQPPGTRSQTVEYRDADGHLIARVHQYRLRDGSLGASGRPDPLALFHEGIMYILDDEEHWDDEW